MVFSLNSRYALQRVQWIPPTSYIFTCLKANEKTLSTKGPKEDTSRPPLRLNIPKDSPNVDPYSKFIRSAQPRSKSLISKSKRSFTPGFEDGLLCKSGSEMHFSSFRQSDELEQSARDQETPSQASNSIPQIEYSEPNNNSEQTYYQTVHQFCGQKEKTESKKEPANKVRDQSFSETFPENLGKENTKVENNAADNEEAKNLFIVIDTPEKNADKKFTYLSTSDSKGRDIKHALPSFVQDDFEVVKSMPNKPGNPVTTNVRMAKRKLDAIKGKASQTKLSNLKGEKANSDPRVKLQVHEIDDTSTYVFQFKFKKGLQGRTCAVGCVPEKEINTRKMDITSPEATINYNSGPECRNRPGREITPRSSPESRSTNEEQLEHVRYPDRRTRGKNKKENSDVEKLKASSADAWASQNSSCLEKTERNESDKVTGSAFKQSAEQDSSSQNYGVYEKSQTQQEDQSTVNENLAYQSQVSASVAEKTAETVSSSSVREESADYQNSKMMDTSHETDKVDKTNNTSQWQASYSPRATDYAQTSNYPQAADSSQASNCPQAADYTQTSNHPQASDYPQAADSSQASDYSQAQYQETQPNSETVTQNQTTADTGVGNKGVKNNTESFRKVENRSRSMKRNASDVNCESYEPESTDFQTTKNIIRIQSERPPTPPKYSAGLPKFMNKALKNQRKGFGIIERDSMFGRKWSHKSEFDAEKAAETLRSPLFFSARETSEVNSTLFKKKDDILHVYKEKTKEDGPKITDNMVNVANENLTESKGKASVDSLSLMKELKEIVDFDLKNAVKIFEGRKAQEGKESCEKIEVKSKTPVSQNQHAIKTTEVQKPEVAIDEPKEAAEINPEHVAAPNQFPGKKENEDSVVVFDAETKKFLVNMEELRNAICHRRENFEETYLKAVCQGLDKVLSNEVHVVSPASPINFELKNGDSILVFDESTQTWKVDFSILEKRKQQMREEEELMRRSELILETFEKLEHGKISNIPRPSTRERKTFDYNNEEWKVYRDSDKGQHNQKSSKSKLPFKEYDAEEIRKRNSDLYDDVFIANKKDSDMTKEVKDVSETSKPKKIARSGSSKWALESKKSDDPCKGDKEEGKDQGKEDKKGGTESKNPDEPCKGDKKDAPAKDQGKEDKKDGPCKEQPGKDDKKDEPCKEQPGKNDKKDGPCKEQPGKDDKKDGPCKEQPGNGDKKDGPCKEQPGNGDKKDGPCKEQPGKGDKKEGPSKEQPGKGDKKENSKEPCKGGDKGDAKESTDKASGKGVTKEKANKESGKGGKQEIPCKDGDKDSDKSKKSEETEESDEPGWGSYIKEDIPPLSPVPKSPPSTEKSSSKGKPATVPPNIKQIDPKKIPALPPDIAKITPDKIIPPGKTGVKIDEPKFRIPLPFGRKKKIEDPKTKTTKADKPKAKDTKDKIPPITLIPTKPEGDPKIKGTQSIVPDSKNPTTKEPPKGPDPKSKPPTAPSAAPKGADSKPKPSPKTADPSPSKPISAPPSKVMEDPKSKMPPASSASINKEHYVSDNIVEMSKYGTKDKNANNKSKQLETVKLNITSDTRTPSKITEINLNKQHEEKPKETSPESKISNASDATGNTCSIENKTFYRNFEKYKTPFSDPEFEEKPTKINSDMESNPNLKKLDNWNKTLVLHDAMKPSENVETWLKDETDKMATLLLKVLQEAADGKPKRKSLSPKGKPAEKITGKPNPYDNIRKKQENTPESFLFKVRTVNIALGGDMNSKPPQKSKSEKKIDQDRGKEIPVQSVNTAKSPKVVEVLKMPEISMSETSTGSHLSSLKKGSKPLHAYSDIVLREPKPKLPDIALDDLNSPWAGRDVETKLSIDLSDDIPGPEILKKISGTWKMFPVIGCQATIFTLLRIFQLANLGTSFWNSSAPSKSGKNAFSNLFTKYGPIVNLQGPLSGNIVLMHKPEHLAGVFEQDSGLAVRSIFDSLEQSRRETENKVLTVGISTDWNKMEWNELKKASNDPLVRGCEKFFRPVEVAGESLISNIRRNRNNQNLVSDNFMREIKQWSLEGLCSVLFEKSFGFLEGRSSNTSWLLEPEKFFTVIEEASEYLSKCERGFQAWRLMSTPSSINLNQAYRSLYTILSKQLYQAELNLKNKNELLKDNSFIGTHDLTFLESMLLNDKMTVEDVICNVIDFLLIGVNTMSSALGFMLYNLAQNVKVQDKLLKEVKEMLPDKTSRLDYHKLHSFKYLQACLKESLRLNSPVPVFFRVLQNDVLISNYIIPKETFVVMDFKFSNMKEQVFDDPQKFMPERWLNEEKWLRDMNSLSSLPFCHGPRAELARRVVEMQLWSCIARIVRNFQIEYHFGEIQGTENVFSHPDKPLKLNFVERDE